MLNILNDIILQVKEKPCSVITVYVLSVILVYLNTTVHELGHVSVIRKYSPESKYKIKQYGIYGVTLTSYYEVLAQNVSINETEIKENASAGIKYQKLFSIILFIISLIIFLSCKVTPIGFCVFFVSLYCCIFSYIGFAVTDRQVILNPCGFTYPPKSKDSTWFYWLLLLLLGFIITFLTFSFFAASYITNLQRMPITTLMKLSISSEILYPLILV